jgi:glutamate dehydrogenase
MDNYRQSMALSTAQHQSVALVDEHMHFMQAVERVGALHREVEFLPTDEDLDTRHANGKGLTRPEISVLLAYAKIILFEKVLESDLPDDPYLANNLGTYFPDLIQKRLKNFISGHPLRREIIATYVSNAVVNRTGPGFIANLYERTGRRPSAIARMYLVCRQVFKIADLWGGVESLDNSVPADAQTEMHLEILHLIKRGTMWFLHNESRGADIDSVVGAYRPAIEILNSNLNSILTSDQKSTRDSKANRYIRRKVPKALAFQIANLDALAPACDIVRITADTGIPPTSVAKIYYGIGSRFGLDWLRATAEALMEGDNWRKSAAYGVVEDLYTYQTELTIKIMDVAGGADVAPAIIEDWSNTRHRAVRRVTGMVDDLKTASAIDLSMLSVVNRELRALVSA